MGRDSSDRMEMPGGLRHGTARAVAPDALDRLLPFNPVSERTRERGDGVSSRMRGGSWDDKPKRAGSAFPRKHPAWRQIYNVGTRVIVPDPVDVAGAGRNKSAVN